ncbi:dihydroxyacetone phosphate acyltransferase-like [Mixophyes fleayi]|uniref:dihydroxyacetone phosphate acyltransferase-like n=1 Tax=Mixophyes fleayi TaxID=3061075 RepID=UPI003F4E14A7
MARPMIGTFFSLNEIKDNIRKVFEDVLEEQRQSSDLQYAFKSFTPVIYKNITPCKPSGIKSIVMDSDSLQYVMKQISEDSGEPFEAIQEQAAEILDEMGHNLKLGAIRLFAFSLSKIVRRLYQKLFVNVEGIQSLAKAIEEHPVVLMPSHRSYIDFLLVSYIMYTYNMAIPVIAAGEDLSHMKLIGTFLRLSGAFFIRRTFHGNRLYWAVFAEYVKTMLRNGYAPLEFFIEGQRSRTGKAICPRFGLLNVAMEPFFKGEVFDTYLIPISISYDKLLEESFYVQELLGSPKAKETTSGLIRARKLLSEDFGNIHIFFGKPISLRSLASGRINRSQYNLIPRHLPHRSSEDMQQFTSDMAYKVELHQIANTVLSPGVLIATILLQNLPALNYNALVEKTLWLKDLTEAFGGCVDWPDNITDHEVIQSNLNLHSNIMCLVDDQVVLLEHSVTEVLTEELVVKQAVTFLTGASYRNQLINFFVRPALLLLACKWAQNFGKEDVYTSFIFMRNVFSKEFIFFPGYEEQDFEEACLLLTKYNIISVTPSEIVTTANDSSLYQFLYKMLYSFLEGYQLSCTYLAQKVTDSFTEKQYISGARTYVSKHIMAGSSSCFDALSSDMLKNTLATFVQLGIVKAIKSSSGTNFLPDTNTAKEMALKLGVPSEMFSTARL